MMKDLISALNDTVELLKTSEDSDWAGRTVSQISEILGENISTLESDGSYQKETLGVLFGPTGSLQETAIWNNWHDEYMRLSSIVDIYTKYR